METNYVAATHEEFEAVKVDDTAVFPRCFYESPAPPNLMNRIEGGEGASREGRKGLPG